MSDFDQPVADCSVLERYEGVRQRVWHAAERSGREPASVTLVAVTKTFDAPEIELVLTQGHRSFGENRVQEAAGKWPALRERFPGIDLHLLGPLQTNKVRDAVGLFNCIQTLDREKLAAAIASEAQRQGRQPKLLVQVNTGLEPQKAGVASANAEAFVVKCARDFGLAVSGLMCIPPVQDDPAAHFHELAALGRQLGLSELSMGMSGDFEAAIEAGATMVRVGSAIFGSR